MLPPSQRIAEHFAKRFGERRQIHKVGTQTLKKMWVGLQRNPTTKKNRFLHPSGIVNSIRGAISISPTPDLTCNQKLTWRPTVLASDGYSFRSDLSNIPPCGRRGVGCMKSCADPSVVLAGLPRCPSTRQGSRRPLA